MCSKTCGGGEKIRTRKCDNPAPVGEGRNCSGLGPPIDARPCNNETCPISGGYSIWSQFSPCTKSCGSGTQYRKRNCTNPPPGVGGQNCSRLGPPKETVYCNNEYCPIDGGYGEWSPYTICSRTCGVGQRARSRSCVNPSPQYGGKNCSQIGKAQEIDVCNTKKCPGKQIVVRFYSVLFGIFQKHSIRECDMAPNIKNIHIFYINGKNKLSCFFIGRRRNQFFFKFRNKTQFSRTKFNLFNAQVFLYWFI